MLNLPSVQDVMNLAVGHEKFLLRNTGLTNDATVDHFVFNPQNVLSNNRHFIAHSQMEAQPNGDATTEGQSLQILGYIYMYRGTKEQYWLDRAIAMWEAYVEHFYQGQAIPDQPGRWLSNWIINGKEPVLANWPIDFDNPTHSGFLGSEMTWVNGKTQIPQDAPNWGQYLDKATFAFKGALAWNTIVADVMAVNADGSTDWSKAGEKYPVDWLVDYLGRKIDWDGNILEEVASEPKGTVQLKDTTVNGVYKLCYANCQPVEHGGYLIGRNEAWHNRPLRVPITKTGNLGNAADAELWFCDACYQLWDITKEDRYFKAWRSVQYMVMDYSNIDRYDKFFRQSKYDESPWTDGISYDYDYPSDAVVNYGRDADGYITINLDKAAQHTMEQQSIAYEIDDQAVVTVNVGGKDVNGQPLTVKVNMELADNKTDTTGTSWQINLPDTPADGSVATYKIPMTSMSLANNPNGDYIVADKRVMSDWGNVTHEFTFEDNVYDTRSAQICTSTVKSDEDGVIIGFWLTKNEKVVPTEIVYRTDEQHEWWITLTDADSWRWHWVLPATRIWDHVVLDPKDLRLNGYQPDQAGRPLPLNPNLVAVDQISIAVDDMLGSSEAKFSWYCVNDIPPTFANHTAWTRKFSITIQGQAAFNALLGDCDMQNPNYNPLKYTPGVIPFSNNATNGIVEFDGWRGLPYPGYQHPFIYVHENEPERLNNMVDFLYDSQQAYYQKFGQLGPGAAAYVWNRWDNIKYGTADTFTFYHWGDGHPWAGYQPRAFASAARAWHEMVISGVTVPTKLIVYVENWITWLVKFVEQYGVFPTDFPSETLPVGDPTDFTGHMTGLWLAGASFAALSGSPLAKLDWLIEKAVKELSDNYIVVRDQHVMNGSWSPGVREDTDNGMFFGFWSGEILRGLGTYLMYRRGVPGEELDILERTLSNLTQVGSGGVTRPDIALRDDLDGVTQTANNASDQAKSTAELLETRVPIGRTINNMPLSEDIQLTPEILDTYDRKTIDQKISAVANSGYNPVHVNGHLLDKDVILSAGDIGTYSSSELDGKLNLKVPTSRTVNGKALTGDVTLAAGDVGAYAKNEVDTKVSALVPASRTINGQALTDNITLTAKDVGAPAAGDVVPRTFTINGQPMTGTGLTVSAGGDSYTKTEIDTKLNTYLPLLNDYGLGTTPQLISAGKLVDSAQGSGFYAYAEGDDLDADGNPIKTNLEDRPTGSTTGKIVVLATGGDTNVVSAFAFPDDIAGVFYRKGSGDWTKLADEAELADYIKTNSEGLVETPIVMKNATAIRAEVTPGGGWKDILNVTENGAMEVGSSAARLFLYSSNDPSVEIDGTDYKIYTEHNPPPSSGGTGGGLLAVQTFTANGTYTPTAGTKKIIVELIGGGGSGASPVAVSQSYQVGLGGLGGNYIKAILTSNIKAMSVTVGNGGKAADNGGNDGGTTSLGNAGDETTQFVSAYGGLQGETLVLASLPIPGEYLRAGSTVAQAYGFQTISYKDGSDGGLLPIMAEAHLAGGKGGDTPLGTGGNGQRLAAGMVGVGFGSGGGGGCAKANESGTKGGNGSNGAVIIYEYS